jgi:hypothetical protein
MKKRSRGWPSSDKRKRGLEKEAKSCTRRDDANTLSFLKYGDALERAITRAGYTELRFPDVVATIEYTVCSSPSNASNQSL